MKKVGRFLIRLGNRLAQGKRRPRVAQALSGVVRDADAIITANEVTDRHGTGVIVRRLFGESPNIVSIRSSNYYGEEPFGTFAACVSHKKLTRAKSFETILGLLNGATVGRVLCVPYSPSELITGIVLHELFRAPLCTYVMDDANVKARHIPDSLMREALEKSALRLAISPEMRDAYEQKFGLRFWLLPPVVTPAAVQSDAPLPAVGDLPSANTGVMVGSVWGRKWLDKLRRAVRESGLEVDWYGNFDARHLKTSVEELAQDGIVHRGFLPEGELRERLRSYPFALVPSGTLDQDDDRPEIAGFSLPTRVPFLLAAANMPMIVLGSPQTAAGQFVARLGVGVTAPYDGAALRAAAAAICTADQQSMLRGNAAGHAKLFSAAGMGQWVWDALERGEPTDDKFGRVLCRGEGLIVSYIEPPAPADLWRDLVPSYHALRRLRVAGYRPEFLLDIGASNGCWSDMAKGVFPGARCILVDPLLDRHIARCDRHVRRNRDFECVVAAVSNEAGEVDLQVSGDLYGSSLLRPTDHRAYETVKVRALTLDQLREEKDLQGRGLMKIDVQCAEHLVLEGARGLLPQVDGILIELSLIELAPGAKLFLEMCEMFQRLGFRYYDDAGGWRCPIKGTLLQKDVLFLRQKLFSGAMGPSDDADAVPVSNILSAALGQDPELELIARMKTLLPDAAVLDIGANEGDYSERLLAAGYEVYAFEPNPEVFGRLSRRVGGKPGFHALPCALGAADTTMPLHLAKDMSEGKYQNVSLYSSLIEHDLAPDLVYSGSIEVPVRTLHGLHESREIPEHVSVAKIDTEGFDLKVIQGMGAHRYPLVMTEFWDEQFPFGRTKTFNRLQDLVETMRGRGYARCILFCRFNDPTEVSWMVCQERSPIGSWGNVLFFQEESLYRAAAAWCRQWRR